MIAQCDDELRVHDIIESYHPTFVCGDLQGKQQTKIKSIGPDRNPILVLDNYEVLAKDRLVCRKETLINHHSTLLNNGRRWPIQDYQLKFDIPHETSLADFIAKRSSELSSIAKKNNERMKEECHKTEALFLDDVFQGEKIDDPVDTTIFKIM